ncbi:MULTISPECIES: multidrug transporter [Marinobacter]|uniref:multidrug transporter n=1 Tax=Marinobacter TaxID=2742 RepID=UPI000DACBEF2|nr:MULTISPECIES: multidrug transporter [Marinobacter]
MPQDFSLLTLAAVGGLLALIGLAFFIRPRWFFSWLKGTFAIFLIAAGAYIGLLALDLRHYQSLESLETIATIGVSKTGPQTWRVRLERNERPPMEVVIRGDQWQVDARILRLEGPLAWLGVKPAYRLDRLSGRYVSLEQERTGERTVYSLGEPSWFDSWLLDQDVGLPFVKAVYGNATFMPLRDGAVFDVRLSSTGLVALPGNDAARTAMDEWFPKAGT